jgi:hypothetical protein
MEEGHPDPEKNREYRSEDGPVKRSSIRKLFGCSPPPPKDKDNDGGREEKPGELTNLAFTKVTLRGACGERGWEAAKLAVPRHHRPRRGAEERGREERTRRPSFTVSFHHVGTDNRPPKPRTQSMDGPKGPHMDTIHRERQKA